MPKELRQLRRDAYCSAPPLPTSLRPPGLSRDIETKSLRAPIIECKREVTSSIKSAVYVIDEDFEIKPVIKTEEPQRLRAGLAALAIRQPPSTASSSTSGKAAGPQGHQAGECEGWPCRSYQTETWARQTRLDDEAGPKGQRPARASPIISTCCLNVPRRSRPRVG